MQADDLNPECHTALNSEPMHRAVCIVTIIFLLSLKTTGRYRYRYQELGTAISYSLSGKVALAGNTAGSVSKPHVTFDMCFSLIALYSQSAFLRHDRCHAWLLVVSKQHCTPTDTDLKTNRSTVQLTDTASSLHIKENSSEV